MISEGSAGISSGLLSAGAAQVIVAQHAVYLGATLIGGTAAASLAVFDNASASSGVQLDQLNIALQGAAGDDSIYHEFDGINAKNGITVTLTGANAKCIIWFQYAS